MSSKDETIQQGGCSCGQVRYQMTATPLFVHCCHCSLCQQQSGSAFALNAMIEASHVELLKGELEAIEVPTPSGRGQKVSRCSQCKVAVWSNYGGAGDALHFVRVGTLDSPESCPPDIHIYTSTKQQWVQIPEGMPAVSEYYSAKEYWPEQSLERMSKLMS